MPRSSREPSVAPDAAKRARPGPTLDAVIREFTARWERGEPVCAEDYVDQLSPEAVAEFIYREFCLAEADNLEPDPAIYLQRFPDHSAALSRLFSLHHAFSVATLRQMVEPGQLPSEGDEIGPYRLLRELGRGAFARVFLAEQADLGDRLVVLKVSTRRSAESTLLARARHANIVEVLRHTEADDGALHLVCMPFLGGATLGAVLDECRRRTRSGLLRLPRSGRRWLDCLDRTSAPEYAVTGAPRAARELVARLSYPQVLAWIVARLADALDHAERRGVTHGDIKPSNILITADGTPMLFDFNLAVDWHVVDATNPGADLGGTLAYMAPERLRALGGDPSGSSLIDSAVLAPARRQPDRHRADLYALGLVLAEALTGEPPAIPARRSDDPRQFASGLARLRAEALAEPARLSKGIPPALRSILARCLAPDPIDRYARGAELAEDLDRWRSDRPLAHAPEPSRSAWARRARALRLPIIALALTLGTAAAAGTFAWTVLQGSRRDQALAKLTDVLDHTEGVFQTRKLGSWRNDSNEDPGDLATRLLARYDVVRDPSWRDQPDVSALPERERGELEAWMLEQVLRRAVAYGDRPNSPDDYRRGLVLLDREIARTPYAALLQQRAVLRERLRLDPAGPVDLANSRRPAPWLDAYLRGVQAEPLHAREALGYYLDSLTDRPDFFWGHYRAACVACRIDAYPLAIRSLRACVDRRPKNEMLRNLLASTMYTLGRYAVPDAKLINLADAQAECDEALALNPDFAPATRTRSMISQLLGQNDSVRGDSERFNLLTRAINPTESLLLQISLKFTPGEARQPFSAVEEAGLRRAIAGESSRSRAKSNLADVLAHFGRTAETLDLYEDVISDDPAHLNARFERAVELAQAGRPEGYAELTNLVDSPRFEEIYRIRPSAFRAFNYLACDALRRGEIATAEAMIKRGWEAIQIAKSLRDEVVSARLQGHTAIHARGELHYNAARVDAVAAKTDPTRLAGAVAHLRSAFAENPEFRTKWFPRDYFFGPYRTAILEQIDLHPNL